MCCYKGILLCWDGGNLMIYTCVILLSDHAVTCPYTIIVPNLKDTYSSALSVSVLGNRFI